MGSAPYEQAKVGLKHPGRPILACPLCRHLQGLTQLVDSTWSRPVFRKLRVAGSVKVGGWQASSQAQTSETV